MPRCVHRFHPLLLYTNNACGLSLTAPCVVPHVTQGKVILIGRNETAMTSTVVQHGEALSVDCEQHYEFLANLAPVTCNNGTWTSMPKCDPARSVKQDHIGYLL